MPYSSRALPAPSTRYTPLCSWEATCRNFHYTLLFFVTSLILYLIHCFFIAVILRRAPFAPKDRNPDSAPDPSSKQSFFFT
jgi:hypothetical protein